FLLVEIERLERRDQPALFLRRLMALPGEAAEALGFGLDPVRAVEPDQRVFGQVREYRGQWAGEVGHEKLDAGERNAGAHRLELIFFLAPIDVELEGALIQPPDHAFRSPCL